MKKFLKYIITLVIVFVISMATTVKLLSPNTGGNNNATQIADGSGSSPAMEKLLKYFQSLNSFDVWGEIDLNTSTLNSSSTQVVKASQTESETKVNTISYSVSADITNLNNAKVDAKINYFNANGTKSSVAIVFDGSMLYLNAMGKKIMVSNATISEVVGLVLSNLNLENGAEGLLEKFDVSQIMVALGQMKETQNENGTITSTLKLDGIATVDIITDNNYDLKSLKIYDCSLIDAPFEMNLNIEKTEECNLQVPEDSEEYLNITTFTNSIKNTLSLKTFSVSPTVDVVLSNGKVLNLNMTFAKIEDGQSSLVLNLGLDNLKAQFVVLGNVVYAEIGSVKIKVDVLKLKDLINDFIGDSKDEQTDKIVDEIQNAVTQNKPQIENFYSEVKSWFNGISLNEWLKSVTEFNLNATSISAQVDLSKISALNLNTKISFKLVSNLESQLIESININVSDLFGANANCNLKIEDSAEIYKVQEEDYFSLPLLEDAIKNTINLSELTLNLGADVELNNGKVLAVSAKLAKQGNQLALQIALNYEENSLELIVIDNQIYANVNSFKFKADISRLNSIISEFIGENGNEQTEQLASDLDQLLNENETLINEKFENFVQKLKTLTLTQLLNAIELQTTGTNVLHLSIDLAKLNSLNLQTNFNLTFTLNETETLLYGLQLNINNLNGASVKVNLALNSDAEQIVVTDSEYLSLTLLEDAIKNTINIKEFTINTSLNLVLTENRVLNLDASFAREENGTQTIVLNLSIDSLTAKFIVIGQNVYAEIEGLKIKVDLAELRTLINNFTGESENEQLNEMLNKIEDFAIGYQTQHYFEEIKNALKTLTISEILSAIKVQNYGTNKFSLAVDLAKLSTLNINTKFEITFDINKQLELLDSLKVSLTDVCGADAKLNLSLKNTASLAQVNVSDYLNLVEVANNLKNLLTFKTLSANLTATIYDGNSAIYQLMASINASLNEQGFTTLEEKILNLINSNYLSVVASLGGNANLNAKVVLIDNELYVNLNNTYIKISRADLYELIGISGNAQILDELIKLDIINQIKESLNNENNLTTQELLDKLKQIKIETIENSIKIVLSANLVKADRELVINLGLINEQISNISISGLKIADYFVNLNADLKLNGEITKETPQEDYFNLTEGYQSLLDLLSLNSAKIEAQMGIYEIVNSSLTFGGVQYDKSFNALIEKISDPNAKTLDLYGAIETFNLENNLNLKIYYQGSVLYVEYKSDLGDNTLKVKINKENITESIIAVCSMFLNNQEQIDAIVSNLDNVHSFLEGAGIETIVDLNSLSLINLVNNFKGQAQMGSGVTLSQVLALLENITINSSGLNITLPADLINARGQMKLVAQFNNGSVDNVSIIGLDGGLLADVLSGLGLDLNNKFIDLNLKINSNLESVTKVTDQGYINLNGIDEILKSASNAINNNKAFKLSGKVNAGLKIGSSTYNIEDVQVNITANLNENGLELLIDLPSIPVVLPGIVFKAATKGRSAQIYYNNGMVYIYRFDDQLLNRNDKEYRYSCTLDWCFANFADVLGYALGFTDTITDAIRDSINSVDSEAPAGVIENIIKDFSGEANGTTSNYSVTISGAALAQKTALGDMTFKIVTNNQTHNIEQIGINMVFVDLISLNGMLNFEAFTNTQPISFDTNNYEFKG